MYSSTAVLIAMLYPLTNGLATGVQQGQGYSCNTDKRICKQVWLAHLTPAIVVWGIR